MKTVFNIHTFLKTRPLSYSALASFEYDPEQWYRTYILNEKQSSKEMTFGSMIDLKIQNDRTFLPTLPRYPHMQYKMKVVFDKISLVGVPDGVALSDINELADYKTGKVAWTQKRADETKQLTFYLLLLYITKKIPPESFKCFIHWLPTEERGDFSIGLIKENDIRTFETRRTMSQVLECGAWIKSSLLAMEKYVNEHVDNSPN